MMLVMHFLGKAVKLRLQAVLFLHRRKNGFPVQTVPVRRYDGRGSIFLLQELHRRRNLLFACFLRMRKNDTACVFHLVVEKFAEVLHIHLAFGRVHDGAKCVQRCVFKLGVCHRLDNVAQFPDTRGLDDDSVGGILRRHFLQRLGEIPDEGTADTTRVHLGDIHACVLQKSAVDTDLAEFVFNQYDFLSCVRFLNEFFDERRFPCA